MASITTSGRRRTIQFVGQDCKRHSIRLGECDRRTAEGIALHVSRLIQAKRSGMPVHDDTSRWLGGISDDLHTKISRAGLCDPRAVARGGAQGIKAMIDAYIARRTDLKDGSITMLKQARDKLVGFFGAHRNIGSITPADATDFKRNMLRSFSGAYVAKLINLSRQFFKDAVDRRVLESSPFAAIKAGSQKNPARQRFIAREVIDHVIASVSDPEWKLIVAMARYGGLRVPSEILALKWSDIHWDEGRFRVCASKTEHHVGHESRDVPLFPELLEPLRLARRHAAAGAVYVIQRYRQSSVNLRTRLLHTLEKAGVEPWPKLFQNLRSTRQTELAQTWPEYIVCKWMGNSERVAINHYLQMTDDHFKRAAAGLAPGAPVRTSSGAQSDAAEAKHTGERPTGAQPESSPQAHPRERHPGPRDRDDKGGAKSGAAHAGEDSQQGAPRFRGLPTTIVKTTTNENVPAGAGTCESIGMGAVGFEPTKA